MPQYGQRTNPFYPNTGQDVPPQELGGMAYNPYSSGTDWGFALRNTLNNLLAIKQAQAQADKEQRDAEAKIIREQAETARKAQLEQKKFELDKRAADIAYMKNLNPEKTQHEQTVDALITGGFAKDAGSAEMLIGAYETAEQKHAAELNKEMASEAKAAAKEAERDRNAENKDLLSRAKDLTIKITGRIRGIEKDPLRGPDDPQIKDLTVMNNFIQRRMNKAIAGKLNDSDKDMLTKVAIAIESGDVGAIADTGVPQTSTPNPMTAKPTGIPPGTKTATNPMTGEKLALVNGQWIKIN